MSSSSSFPQSAPLTYSLAALGGVLEVFATALLAYPDAREKEGYIVSRAQQRLALAGNIFFQIMASLAGNLFATWFGPVSLVGPIFFSAQLVANMIVFGFLLGLENLTTEMEVGTYVIVVSTVLLPIVGPGIQEDQNARELLSQGYAIVWSLILLGGMTISAIFLFVFGISRYKEWTRMVILLVARSTCFTLNLTASRVFVMEPGIALIIVSVVVKIVSGVIYTWAIVVQSTEVVQSKFVPVNATTLMLLNAVTGIIIWEDWRVVESWVGYVCVFLLLALASYLLLTGIPPLTSENPEYGQLAHFRKLRMRRSVATRSFNAADLDFSISSSSSDEEEGESEKGEEESDHNESADEFHECDVGAPSKESKDEQAEKEKGEGDQEAPPTDDVESSEPAPPPARRAPRPGLERAMTRRDAWASVYHLHNH